MQPTTRGQTMGIRSALKRMITGPEPQPIPELGRNDRCWCGSGRKYKACHLADDARRRSASLASAKSAPTGRGF